MPYEPEEDDPHNDLSFLEGRTIVKATRDAPPEEDAWDLGCRTTYLELDDGSHLTIAADGYDYSAVVLDYETASEHAARLAWEKLKDERHCRRGPVTVEDAVAIAREHGAWPVTQEELDCLSGADILIKEIEL